MLLMGIWIYMHSFPDIEAPKISDLIPVEEQVAEADNAFPLFYEAFELMVEPEDIDLNAFIDGNLIAREEVQTLLEQNQAAFGKVREGLERPGFVQPGFEYNFEMLIPEIGGWWSLAHLMRAQVIEYLIQGDLKSAVEMTVDLNQWGARVTEHGAVLIHSLVGIAILSYGLEETRGLIRDPRISPEHLNQLLSSLPEISILLEGVQKSQKGEFMMIKDVVDRVAKNEYSEEYFGVESLKYVTWFPGAREFIFQPNRTLSLVAEETRNNIAYLEGSGSKPVSILDRFPPIRIPFGYEQFRRPNALGMVLIFTVLPAYGSIKDSLLRTEASIDSCKLLAALKTYELDKGVLPERLQDLVPGYLDGVPLDPFDQQAFRYDRARGLVYSIGKDRVDDGGLVSEDEVFSLRKSSRELEQEEEEIIGE
jgi:hypothetical protein